MLAIWFGTAAIVSVTVLRVQRASPMTGDFPIGVVLGIVNVAATFALLSALEHLPGAVVFPVAGAGGVLLVVASSAIIWHERLSRLALAGIVRGRSGTGPDEPPRPVVPDSPPASALAKSSGNVL